MSRTILQYNYTNENIPGAYYGILPELPKVNLAVPNGTIDLIFNLTEGEDFSSQTVQRWDYLYNIYYNRPDSTSSFPSLSGYEYRETVYFGHAFLPPGNISFTANGPEKINETTHLFSPGDCFVAQLIELSEDGSTPTGRRFFAQNVTIVQNETLPITTTFGVSENPLYPNTQSYSVVSTSSRAPPASTYPWTAEAAAMSSSISGSGAGPAETSAPANTGFRSTKRSSILQIGTALLLISAAVAAL